MAADMTLDWLPARRRQRSPSATGRNTRQRTAPPAATLIQSSLDTGEPSGSQAASCVVGGATQPAATTAAAASAAANAAAAAAQDAGVPAEASQTPAPPCSQHAAPTSEPACAAARNTRPLLLVNHALNRARAARGSMQAPPWQQDGAAGPEHDDDTSSSPMVSIPHLMSQVLSPPPASPPPASLQPGSTPPASSVAAGRTGAEQQPEPSDGSSPAGGAAAFEAALRHSLLQRPASAEPSAAFEAALRRSLLQRPEPMEPDAEVRHNPGKCMHARACGTWCL